MTKENKMGTMPINKLLITMSVPIIISMLIQALYNVVDSIFVSRLSEDALTAVSLAFPAQNIMVNFAVGAGLGTNALLSRSLGEKNPEKAVKVTQNGIFIFIVLYIIFLLLGIFLVRPFFALQTKNADIVELGCDYLQICTILSFGIFGEILFERLLQATGKTIYTMFTQGIGAIVNIILDPILIFGLFGVPKMGIKGAAIATVIGQMVAMTLGIVFNLLGNKEISITLKGFKPSFNIIKNIFSIGTPSIIMASIGSVTVFSLNRILMAFSSTAVAVLGVYYKVQSFAFMPVFGLNNGMVPIVSYNYGARNRKRIEKTIAYSVFYAMGIMLICFSILQIFPREIFLCFSASEDMLRMGIPALRTITICWIAAGFCIVSCSVFQALGRGFLATTVSFMRQLVLLLPVAYLLSLTGNVNMVWWAFPIAEFGSLSVAITSMVYLYKKLIKNL